MSFWLLLTVNSVTFGGLLFLLSAGFSLIFGLMRIPNLTHGSMFVVGAYLGSSLLTGALGLYLNFWVAAFVGALEVAALGALMERLLLRRLAGQQLAQVLVTLGVSFMVADLCLMGWGGDPISVATPAGRGGAALSPRHYRHRSDLRRCAVAHAGAHPARRHDPCRGGRSANGAGCRYPRLATFHRRVRTGCGAGRFRRRDRQSDPFGLSRARSRHAAAGPGRRDFGRYRKPAWFIRRQHYRRLHL